MEFVRLRKPWQIGDQVRVLFDSAIPLPKVFAKVSKLEVIYMARDSRTVGVKRVALSVVKDDLSRYLREAETGEILITRHGKPAGVLIGFASEDDWSDYRLEKDPRFMKRTESARASSRAANGTRIQDLKR